MVCHVLYFIIIITTATPYRAPEQLPAILSLLCESFNPHVRVGCCYALGIACAATGNKDAVALVEPMLKDSVPFVRQGAFISMVSFGCRVQTRRIIC